MPFKKSRISGFFYAWLLGSQSVFALPWGWSGV